MQYFFVVSWFICMLNNQAVAQLPSYTPTQDLLAWYSYSGNILDNSGNGHNNANYNIVSTTDRFNTMLRALYFSGSGSEYLNYGDVDEFEGHIQLSFSFWILPENHGSNSENTMIPIISKWGAPAEMTGSTYKLVMDGSDLCLILTDNFTADTLKTSLVNIPLNQWSHVVVTTNYGFVKFYINNVLTTDTVTTVSAIGMSTSEFKVGDWYQSVDGSYASYQGKIDDLGLWSKELDTCEIEALYTTFDCATAGLTSPEPNTKDVVGIFDLTGRMVEFEPNTPLFFMYSDGSRKRIFIIE